MDVAATCPVDRIEIALDDALRRGIVTLRRLSWRLDEVGARGRAGAAPLRRLLIARAEGCAPAHSPLETRFARLLRAAGLPPPHRQFEIYDGDCFVARVDFAYPEHGLVIELDGYGYHSGRVEWEKDLMRRNHIESAGYRVLHITARRMNEDPEGVVALVRSLMDPGCRSDVVNCRIGTANDDSCCAATTSGPHRRAKRRWARRWVLRRWLVPWSGRGSSGRGRGGPPDNARSSTRRSPGPPSLSAGRSHSE